jgi:hypothetical protein
MGDKRQKNQLEPAFTAGWKGEARKPDSKGTESSLTRYETESLAESKRVMEAVCEARNLKQALRRVKGNGGSPGIDGMKTEELARWLIENWVKLREELLEGRYRPQPVKRVEIEKPDRRTRKLGIPTVIDRFVQQAVSQVLQKIWDPTFSESSERAGQRVMGSLRRLITRKLRLQINENKSAVARPNERAFLGFSFTRGEKPRRSIAPRSKLRCKQRIREITGRTRGRKLGDIVQELNLYLNGWRGYFGFCETRRDFEELDGWIRRSASRSSTATAAAAP